MSLTQAEKRRRKENLKVKYLKEHLCNCESGKDYVFISYKSDDWEIVLTDVVYRLVHDYGLNVYFDGDFDAYKDVWVNQFPKNMKHKNCKGVIAFVDNKYATSYATLLELLVCHAGCNDEKKMFKPKTFVPINLEKLALTSEITDTGLGKEEFNGIINVHAKTEQKRFDDAFDRATNKDYNGHVQFVNVDYETKGELDTANCFNITYELLKKFGANDNDYNPNDGTSDSLDDIEKTIRDAFGGSVFSEIDTGKTSHHSTNKNIEPAKESIDTVAVQHKTKKTVISPEESVDRFMEKFMNDFCEYKRNGEILRDWKDPRKSNKICIEVSGNTKGDFNFNIPYRKQEKVIKVEAKFNKKNRDDYKENFNIVEAAFCGLRENDKYKSIINDYDIKLKKVGSYTMVFGTVSNVELAKEENWDTYIKEALKLVEGINCIAKELELNLQK